MDLRNLIGITAWFNLNKAGSNTEELVKLGRHTEELRRGLKGRTAVACVWIDGEG